MTDRPAGIASWLDVDVTSYEDVQRVVSASLDIVAGSGRIFEFIADPAQQPRWDGNDNMVEVVSGQRVHALGEAFTGAL